MSMKISPNFVIERVDTHDTNMKIQHGFIITGMNNVIVLNTGEANELRDLLTAVLQEAGEQCQELQTANALQMFVTA